MDEEENIENDLLKEKLVEVEIEREKKRYIKSYFSTGKGML